jgi:hypothetical protein
MEITGLQFSLAGGGPTEISDFALTSVGHVKPMEVTYLTSIGVDGS